MLSRMMPLMRTAAPRRGLLLALAVVTAGTPFVLHGAGERAAVSADEIGRLQQERESLTRQSELAASGAFYLLVDPAAGQLTLAYRGTPLRRYTMLDARVGVPRVAFFGRNPRPDWAGTVWSGGRLEPGRPSDRVEFKVTVGGPAEEPPPPPSPPEVAIPVPATYLLRYEPGLVIEIDRPASEARSRWARLASRLRSRGREAAAALSPSQRSLVRLRIVLAADEADSLYRSVPPDTRLLIVAARASRGRSPSDQKADISPAGS